ncbi:cysteine dioxygenase [Emticicia sp. 17c]|uniref:cysteine dioxygenase n=1 Tax=Emticicia sp. 17c TaxID=3127704 RepID=UPI00301C120C
MSFSNPNLQFVRERRFNTSPLLAEEAAEESQELLDGNQLSLIIKGQGVVIFKAATAFTQDTNLTVAFHNNLQSASLALKLGVGSIVLTKNGKLLAEQKHSGLTTNDRAFYWISLDSQNHCIRFGVGEARLETQTFVYQFSPDTSIKKFLESLEYFNFDNNLVAILRALRDPILNNVPLTVKNTDELTMDMIATSAVMPKANLSTVAQKLYDNIAGKKFTLNTTDFPDFAEAIEYSIATPGCWCYEKLKSKAGEFGEANPKKVYLRITLGQNGGESPGIPYVMEIWPPGCYSPIHNHAGANAVIRVLHGQINVRLFPYLGIEEPFGNATFSEEDITWISPTLNQFHKLQNPNEQGPTCITIQCYMYDENDLGHYDYFDYIADDDEIKQYEPDSDMDFVAFKNLIRKEWAEK